MALSRQLRWFLNAVPGAATQPVLDVGCGDGTHLASFGPGSLGLAGEAEFLTSDPSRTYEVIRYPFDRDVADVLRASGKPSHYPLLICMNTLEHVLSPHQHLLMLRRVMEDDSTLFLSVPVAQTAIFRLLDRFTPERLSRLWRAYLQKDHVNFWTAATFELTVNYAGFEIIKRYHNGPSWLRLTAISPTFGVLCRKIPHWNYEDWTSVKKTLDTEGHLRWKDDQT
jgi:SAM-dependent methyltransferase